MKACTTCGTTKPLTEYHKHSLCKGGLSPICKACHYIKGKEYRLANLEKYREYQKTRKQDIKNKLVAYKGGCCQICKTIFPSAVYDFHHLDPSIKEARVSELSGSSFKKAKLEVDKCILVCANCHRLIHANEIILTK